MLLQPVAKALDGGFVEQATKLLELSKLSVQRCVKKGLHDGVGQAEPLLHEMCAQHGLKAKGLSAGAPIGVVRCDQLDQRSPWHDLIHLLQKLAFAGFLSVQV